CAACWSVRSRRSSNSEAGIARAHVEGREKFLPGLAPVTKYAEHAAGDHCHAGFVHAARGHALMCAFEHDGGTERLEHAVDAARDLRGHAFLNLQPFGIDVDQPGEL